MSDARFFRFLDWVAGYGDSDSIRRAEQRLSAAEDQIRDAEQRLIERLRQAGPKQRDAKVDLTRLRDLWAETVAIEDAAESEVEDVAKRRGILGFSTSTG
ncbi:MAG TPA: hypothetical protein VMS76_00410 [Planctomycetota bacterium]|nr:hypothetical protein [Planctomycetota bacterium]